MSQSLCLGVETSCDETSLALLRGDRVLSEITASQADVFALFGGVVPEIASREHYRVLGPIFKELLASVSLSPQDIDVVAVARGPGLLGSLLTGLGFAKGVAMGAGARLVGVNHLYAHLLAPGLEQAMVFPALGLLVSGGHTHLYRVDSETSFTRLGRTLDDAAGEAFDKVAKMLNLPYPGGVYIDRLAQKGEPDKDLFPRPYIDNQNLDFSFSGLKTALSVHIKKHPHLKFQSMEPLAPGGEDAPELAELRDVCASFTWSVCDALRIKLQRALDRNRDVRSVIVAGGVAANTGIRATMGDVARERGLPLLLPSPALCTDNGAMVAHAGLCLARAGLFHGLDLEAIPRGREVPWDYLGPA